MSKLEILKKLKSAGCLSDRDFDLGYISTGSYALNKVISGKYSGGYPIGGIVEIKGESSTGKTVFLTHGFAEAQKLDYYTIMLDNEFAYNKVFAQSLGVDPEKLIYDDPETVPECFSRLEDLILEIREVDKDTPIFAAIDSMAGQSDKESEKKISEFDNMDGANRAKEVGQCLRHINPLLRKHRAALVVINQLRIKPGVMYGDPTTRSGGGKGLEYYCAVSLSTMSNKTSDVIRDSNDNAVGIKGRIKNTKNKIAIPFQECDFKLLWDKGLDNMYGLEKALFDTGLVQKNGAWYTVTSTGKKFQGDDGLKEFYESPEFKKYLLEN